MGVKNDAAVPSCKRHNVTEDVLMGAVINSGLCSFQIGFMYGVAPSYICSLAIKNLGEAAFCSLEKEALARLRSKIGELLLAGRSQNEAARECGISSHSFRQLAEMQEVNSGRTASVCIVDDDEDDYELPDTGANRISLKYLDFEISYTTGKDPEESILSICRFLIGGSDAAS